MAADASADDRVIVDDEIEDTDVIEAAEDSESEDEDLTSEESDPAGEPSEPDPLPDESAESEVDAEPATGHEPAAAPTTETESEPAPFTYKGDKGEHTLEGAHYYAGDGLYIPEAQVPKVKQLLAAAAVHNGSWQREKREYERQISTLKTGRTEKDEAADALMDLVFKDLATLETDEEVYEWAVKFRQSIPEHRVAIREKQLEARERQMQERFEPSPEEIEEQVAEVATTELKSTLGQIFAMPGMNVLDDDDKFELWQRFSKNPRRYVITLDRDDPELGAKKGDRIFDGAAILEQVEIARALKARTLGANTAVARAAAANRKKVGTPEKKRTPTPARSSSPATEDAPPRDQRTGRFKTREEYEAWIASGDE